MVLRSATDGDALCPVMDRMWWWLAAYSCNDTYLMSAGGGVPETKGHALSDSNWASSIQPPARMLFPRVTLLQTTAVGIECVTQTCMSQPVISLSPDRESPRRPQVVGPGPVIRGCALMLRAM